RAPRGRALRAVVRRRAVGGAADRTPARDAGQAHRGLPPGPRGRQGTTAFFPPLAPASIARPRPKAAAAVEVAPPGCRSAGGPGRAGKRTVSPAAARRAASQCCQWPGAEPPRPCRIRKARAIGRLPYIGMLGLGTLTRVARELRRDVFAAHERDPAARGVSSL